MEKSLFSSEDIDLTFNFSDHSISSDEDLLPINSHKTDHKSIDPNTDCLQNCSKDFRNSDSNPNFGHQFKQKSEEIDEKLSNEISYYKECPLCQCLGPKSIHHIKHCAHKQSVDPKQVLQFLNKCQKSGQKWINYAKSKANPKQMKRNNKLMDNYVITFGDKKRLEISINPKLINNKNSKIKENKYELSSLDPIERQRILMLKINKQIMDNKSETTDQQIISPNILPTIWSLSLLDSNSDQYFVEGFEKYDTKS